MKGRERRIFEMFVRGDDFGRTRSADFAADSACALLFARLREEINIIEDKAGEQSSGFSIKKGATAARSVARETLHNQLETISRTADALALSGTAPGLENRFSLPLITNDQTLINTARSFAEDVLPFKGSFIGFGLPADFLDNLNAVVAALEQAINRQNLGREMHVAATTAIEEALERGLNIVRQLDAIIRNKYADDAPQLSAWESARHIQRSPRRATEPELPPTTPPEP